MKPIFSIIIPTLNEEQYLPTLLKSIKKQSIQPTEIIVADNDSKDNTVVIATEYGCTVIPGGNPSTARNNGWKFAKSSLIVFMDSDTYLDNEKILYTALSTFKQKNLDYANAYYKNSSKNTTFLAKSTIYMHNIFSTINKLSLTLFKKNIIGSGAFIITKKSILQKLNGFDKSLDMNEDSDIINRLLKKKYKFGYLPVLITLSGRRYADWQFSRIIKLISLQSILNIQRAFGTPNERLYNQYKDIKGKIGGSI